MPLPAYPPLQVQAAMALARLGDADQAERELHFLLKEPVREFADLYSVAGTVLEAAGRAGAALLFYR